MAEVGAGEGEFVLITQGSSARLTPETKNMIGAKELKMMKPSATLINTARGGLVDEQALRAGLESGHVGGAAFDVFVEEPAKANPLFGAPNFVATPHLGASTVEAQLT